MESSTLLSTDADQTIINEFSLRGKRHKIELISTDTAQAVTFCIWEEDHTLGNALRYMIIRNPYVSFCGYSMPHPSEAKLHLRIQTHGPVTAVDALRQGLADLKAMSNHMLQVFNEASEQTKPT